MKKTWFDVRPMASAAPGSGDGFAATPQDVRPMAGGGSGC
ncbi:hypothetical protein LMG26857_03380 [Achromobacter anxifer]|nr:hypothetical protein LMG26857_03380 [Achromobacter anxifer]